MNSFRAKRAKDEMDPDSVPPLPPTPPPPLPSKTPSPPTTPSTTNTASPFPIPSSTTTSSSPSSPESPASTPVSSRGSSDVSPSTSPSPSPTPARQALKEAPEETAKGSWKPKRQVTFGPQSSDDTEDAGFCDESLTKADTNAVCPSGNIGDGVNTLEREEDTDKSCGSSAGSDKGCGTSAESDNNSLCSESEKTNSKQSKAETRVSKKDRRKKHIAFCAKKSKFAVDLVSSHEGEDEDKYSGKDGRIPHSCLKKNEDQTKDDGINNPVQTEARPIEGTNRSVLKHKPRSVMVSYDDHESDLGNGFMYDNAGFVGVDLEDHGKNSNNNNNNNSNNPEKCEKLEKERRKSKVSFTFNLLKKEKSREEKDDADNKENASGNGDIVNIRPKPRKKVERTDPRNASCGKQIQNLILNSTRNLPARIFLLLWIIINVVLFIWKYFDVHQTKNFYYLRCMIGPGLAWARASAFLLNLNGAFILIPVCRNLLGHVRTIFGRNTATSLSKLVGHLLEANIRFHRHCAWGLVINTGIHVGAHLYNAVALQAAIGDRSQLYRHCATIGEFVNNATTNNATINNATLASDDWIRDSVAPQLRQSAVKIVFSTLPGLSGIIMTIVLIIIVATATIKAVKKAKFENFWYLHHLFIVFYIFFLVHGTKGLLKSQINTDLHDPETCTNSQLNEDTTCSIKPTFSPNAPSSYKWLLLPLILYLLERLARMLRSADVCELDLVSKHASNVLEIRFYKDSIKMTEPGQYVFLNVPELSNFQWHPFTLTSAPSDDHLSVHIRAAGDWTKALFQASPDYAGYEELKNSPPWSLHVDGPYGAPSQDWFLYDTAVLIGAGIGITPFASILKDVQGSLANSNSLGTPSGGKRPQMSRRMTRRNTVVLKLSGGRNMRLKKVHLFWLCHDMKCFEWFYGLLQEIEELNHNSLIEIHIHLTRGWERGASRVRSLIKKDLNEALPDPTTRLSERTHYGRPRWPQVFSQIAAKQKNKSIGVFFCGPKPLGDSIRGSLKQVNRDYMQDGTNFVFCAEKF